MPDMYFKRTLCWCCPPDTVYVLPVGSDDPCTWPDCPNADKPDPREDDVGS